MNNTVNMFLLVGDKFMREMHLNSLGLLSACGPFTKNKKRIEKFKQTGNFLFTETNLIKLAFNTIWLMAKQKT